MAETGYSTEEIENFKKLFDIFDKDNSGSIEISDMEQVIEQLGKDPARAKSLLDEIDPNHEGKIGFDDYIKMISDLEKELGDSAPEASQEAIQAENKVLDFLQLLEEYRLKCESEGNYTEAKKAQLKYEELKKKETIRQLQQIRETQEKELNTLEEAQNTQLDDFNKAWDSYMSEYEATAYKSLEKLKEKHISEYQELMEKVTAEAQKKVKHSKELLALRQKQQTLAKQKSYEEAEKIKAKADQLESLEDEKNEAIVKKIIETKEKKLRQQQQMALAALLKRIQRDRNEQIKHREMDSNRLVMRNRNIINSLIIKQNTEAKKTLQQVKESLGDIKKAMKSISNS
jgi:EF-hand domain pair